MKIDDYERLSGVGFLFRCLKCGSLVSELDLELHSEWHKENENK